MRVRELCLCNINHGILAKNATPSRYTKYFTYVYSHMKVYVTDKSLCKDEHILARAVGEEYAEFLPNRMKIDGESAARAHFAHVVRSALRSVKASNPDFTGCLPQGLAYESYEKNCEFKIGYNEGSEFKKYPDPFKNPADFRAKVRQTLAFNNKKADVGALFEVAYDIVLMLAIMMVPMRVNFLKEITFLTYVTFSKKGVVSEDYIKKVETVIKEELHMDMKFDGSQIKKLWKHYELQMSSDLMECCVKSTLAEVPDECVRLRKLVDQCKWQGLTCYRAVKQALDLPEFPWDSLTKMAEYKTEMEAFKEAAKLVGDDAFYGYNPSMGKAKAIHYKNLASVCAKVLVVTKKSRALGKAACFTESYPSKNVVDGIINEYLFVKVLPPLVPKKPKPGRSKGPKTPLHSKSRMESVANGTHKRNDKTKHAPPTEVSVIGTKITSKSNVPSWPDVFDDDSVDEPSWPDVFDNDFDDGANSWPDSMYCDGAYDDALDGLYPDSCDRADCDWIDDLGYGD